MRTFHLLLFTATCVAAHAQLDLGLKAHWTFPAGAPVDISGNGHDGTFQGAVTAVQDRAGNPSCAAGFPGNQSTSVEIPFAADFDVAPSGAFSVSLWYQGGSLEVGDLEWLFRKTTGQADFYSADYGSFLYDLNRAVYRCGDAVVLWSPAMPPIPDDQWHHLAGSYSNGYHTFWLDGQVAGWDSTGTHFITQSTGGLSIGANFSGSIDDIRFYDRVLTPADLVLLVQENASCASTGITDAAGTMVSISPNPTSGLVRVDVEANDAAVVDLLDPTGRTLMTGAPASNVVQLDLSGLADGIYVIRCTTKERTIVRRILKE